MTSVNLKIPLTSPNGANVVLGESPWSREGQKFISFASSNYLDLSAHPALVEAGKDALDKYGASSSASRAAYGNMKIHDDLERKVAEFHQKEDAIVLHSGMDANFALFTPLVTADDVIFSDEYNHSSLLMGMKLTKARKIVYRHVNLKDLRDKLGKFSSHAGKKYIITEGVYSMHATIAPIRDLVDIAEAHDAQLVIDDCHGVGCIGLRGRGVEEHFGLMGNTSTIITGTLGKAFGACGGYITGPGGIVQYIRDLSRIYRFTIGISPSVAASALEGVKIVMNSSERVDKLKTNVRLFRSLAYKKGFTVMGNEDVAICPTIIDESINLSQLIARLRENGILMMGVTFPIISKGDKQRLRFTVTSGHTEEEITYTVNTLDKLLKTLHLVAKL